MITPFQYFMNKRVPLSFFAKSMMQSLLVWGLIIGPVFSDEAPHTQVELLSEYPGFRAGESFWVAISMKMDPHWHTYWKVPGDSGLATSITWTLPQGFSASEIYWPKPKLIETPPLVSYGYEGQVFLLVNITPPKNLDHHTSVILKARVDWLECKEICLPGRKNVELTLPVLSVDKLKSLSPNPLFEQVRAHLPTGLTDEQIIAELSATKGGVHQDNLLIILLFALLGGFILNLMPCVLPILTIKILSFVNQAQDDFRLRLKHGLLFFGGVLLSFWVLAAFVVFVKIGGQTLGWGFQLQSPGFVLVMAVFFVVLSLNMWGVFEVGTSFSRFGDILGKTKGGVYAFLSGVLATLVATPCTAPFMGSAMGYAVTQPAWVSFLIFTAVGTGMAFPYVGLTLFPALLKFVPKPGSWMTVFKKVMALFLLGTSIWLGWVFYLQVSSSQVSYEKNNLQMEPYDDAKVKQYRAQGVPVFIDFTAAWCLTCQVNKRLVFSDPTVISALKEKGVVFMIADWTQRDDSITRALQQYGRNGVPTYVLYGRSAIDEGRLLPEILTPQRFIEELDKLDK